MIIVKATRIADGYIRYEMPNECLALCGHSSSRNECPLWRVKPLQRSVPMIFGVPV
jgi:hypothetical protein